MQILYNSNIIYACHKGNDVIFPEIHHLSNIDVKHKLRQL